MWNKKITWLNGEPVDNLTIKSAVINILQSHNSKTVDSVRSYVLAKSLTEDKDVNEADIKYITNVVKEYEQYVPLVKGQILLALDDYGKEKDDKKKESK